MDSQKQPEQPKEKKVPWYVMEEADNTVRLLGGLIIFLVGMIGLFVVEAMVGSITNPIYLKEGIIHAIFGYITGWISASGRKTTVNGTGRGKQT